MTKQLDYTTATGIVNNVLVPKREKLLGNLFFFIKHPAKYGDYSPETARFTTVDPIRDGNNWFSYVVNDPVNYVDLWGLEASCGTDAGAAENNPLPGYTDLPNADGISGVPSDYPRYDNVNNIPDEDGSYLVVGGHGTRIGVLDSNGE